MAGHDYEVEEEQGRDDASQRNDNPVRYGQTPTGQTKERRGNLGLLDAAEVLLFPVVSFLEGLSGMGVE